MQHQPDPNRIHRISPDDRQRSGPNAITSISRRPQLSPALCDAIDSLARFVGPLPDFLRTLAARAAEALEVRSAEVLELVPEGFVSRARHDFPLAFDKESPLGHDTHAGWAVRTGETLSTNYVFENRFPNDHLRDHGIKSGITTAIGATDGGTSSPWGVLAVHDAKSRDYSADEILFMEKAADLAAAFIRRDAQEQARLREERDRAKHETRRRRTAEYRLGYTAEACQAAAVAVTTRAALKSVARHAVPEIADWCFVDVVPSDAKQTIVRVAVEHASVVTLQEAILPRDIPAIAGVDIGAAYIAASDQVEVGGDWFDVFVLVDGTVALAVGDVAGKGISAAQAMTHVRAAGRVAALMGNAPAEVLRAQNAVFLSGGFGAFATAAFARYDPSTGALEWASAGHLPPLLVRPEDAVMLGDTVYYARAAKAAGVACIGLMCGGIGERELQEAGAVAVYGNPSELLQDLDASPVGRLLDPA